MASDPGLSVSPIVSRVRAYFAPVNRATAQPTLWDPAGLASFDPDAPPAPWHSLGWCSGFARHCGTVIQPLLTGAPATPAIQVRTAVEASVELRFESWGKLQLALTAGAQQLNVLAASTAGATGATGATGAAVPLTPGSVAAGTTTASMLDVGPAAAATFHAGDLVAVDVDYAGQTGWIGSGVSGGYLKSATLAQDADTIRRVTLNVSRILGIQGGTLQLATPLLAGVPDNSMRVSRTLALCDREGASFFQEWSALFLLQGTQGDRVAFHYPRLQSTTGAEETPEALLPGNANPAPYQALRLAGRFRALPITDPRDGETVVCYRSYLPPALATA